MISIFYECITYMIIPYSICSTINNYIHVQLYIKHVDITAKVL